MSKVSKCAGHRLKRRNKWSECWVSFTLNYNILRMLSEFYSKLQYSSSFLHFNCSILRNIFRGTEKTIVSEKSEKLKISFQLFFSSCACCCFLHLLVTFSHPEAPLCCGHPLWKVSFIHSVWSSDSERF